MPQQLPFPVNPNQYVAPNTTARQMAHNVGAVGNAQNNMMPLGYGYGSGPQTMSGPMVAGSGGQSSPYALSTVGGYNPYLGSGASMGASGDRYSLATSPSAGMGGGGGMMWPGYGGFTPESMGYGYALMGMADLTRAQGQYWRDIQAARMSREYVRQEQVETARRRVQYEAWYETMRPTAAKMRQAEMAAELDRARKDPPDTEIQSGRALNTLLSSIQRVGRLNRVATSELSEDLLKNVNLSAGTSSGNVGILREVSKLDWPEGLLDPAYDQPRKQLTDSLKKAVEAVKERERPTTALRRDIDAYFKQINDKLNESADAMSASDYIDARRFMNQLGSAIKALKDPKVNNYFDNTWTARGKTVAELVENMTRDGLTFAPSSPGGEPSYKALYLALRNFEINLQNESRN